MWKGKIIERSNNAALILLKNSNLLSWREKPLKIIEKNQLQISNRMTYFVFI